eukprot:Hpha_TRINITY_DN16862_c2_g2::TRINITY_DN16862_c2_g2_i2::g.150635::m.150635
MLTMKGLGDDEWNFKAQETLPAEAELSAARQWLEDTARPHRGKCGSHSAKLALAEWYVVTGKPDTANTLRSEVARAGFPLAKLRVALTDLSSVRKVSEASKTEELRRSVVQRLSELADLRDRIGARAGVYLWQAYARGTEGLQKDLKKSEALLARGVRYGMESGGRGNLNEQLIKIRRRLSNGGSQPGTPTAGVRPLDGGFFNEPRTPVGERPRSPSALSNRGFESGLKRVDSGRSATSMTGGRRLGRENSAVSLGSQTSQRPRRGVASKESGIVSNSRGNIFAVQEVFAGGGSNLAGGLSPRVQERRVSHASRWDDDVDSDSDHAGSPQMAGSPRVAGGSRSDGKAKQLAVRMNERGAEIRQQLRAERRTEAGGMLPIGLTSPRNRSPSPHYGSR